MVNQVGPTSAAFGGRVGKPIADAKYVFAAAATQNNKSLTQFGIAESRPCSLSQARSSSLQQQ